MNSNRLWIALPVLGLLGITAIVGHFWSRGPTYGVIEGRVTRGGVPLEQVEVVFYPEEGGPRSVALTDKDGHFETMTDAIQKVPARKGVPVGKYRVALLDRRDKILAANLDPDHFFAVEQPLKKMKPVSDSRAQVPAQYNQRLDTPFNDIEVKPGKNWFDLDVK